MHAVAGADSQFLVARLESKTLWSNIGLESFQFSPFFKTIDDESAIGTGEHKLLTVRAECKIHFIILRKERCPIFAQAPKLHSIIIVGPNGQDSAVVAQA